jgi:two-component system, OmpR family, phosphate regulon sensor histidine kinase PhoR
MVVLRSVNFNGWLIDFVASSTGRKQCQDEQMIESFLDAVPLPMIVVGADQRIKSGNPLAMALLGQAMLGRHFAMTLRHPALVSAIEAALAGTRPPVARVAQTIAGQEHVFRVTVTPLPDGTAPSAICVFEDLSEQELVGQMRRDFVANVSHELRTPLTALIGIVETLKGAARDDPGGRDRFLSIMEREAGRMNRLVRDLLSLSRVEADERQRPTDQVDLGGLLGTVISTLRPIAENFGVTLLINETPLPVRVPGDADQLTQVFANLIENGIKYGNAGKVVAVSLTCLDPDPELRAPAVRIDVSDQGEGIDPLHIPRLTERFYRIDTHRSREKGGTGLGLAIVKHIVNRHRGRLRINSELGKGSTFSVHLPLE